MDGIFAHSSCMFSLWSYQLITSSPLTSPKVFTQGKTIALKALIIMRGKERFFVDLQMRDFMVFIEGGRTIMPIMDLEFLIFLHELISCKYLGA